MTLGPSQATIHKSQHLSTAKTAADRSAQRVSAAEAAWQLGGASGLPPLRLYVEHECVHACARAPVSAHTHTRMCLLKLLLSHGIKGSCHLLRIEYKE